MAATTEKQTTNDDIVRLFDVGALINLKIRRWGARKMITRADLIRIGYDPDNLPAELCNLGRKLLVPKAEIQALDNIEQRARKSLEKWSIPFGIASAHFVPIKMLPTVECQIEEMQTEFFSVVDSFITRFDEMTQKVRDDYPDFWEKCLKNHYPHNPKALRERFKFDWYIFKIAGMGSTKETTVDEMVAHQKVNDERTDELRTQMQTEVSEFVEEYVSSMRGETIRFCELVAARINGKPFGDEAESKKLTSKSIACFRNSINRFMSMNIFGDNEIEKMLIEFKATFLDSETNPADFESANVKDSVTKVLETIRQRAATEGESGSKFIGELKRRVIL